MNASRLITRCVVPSRHGILSFNSTCPAALSYSRSSESAGQGCSSTVVPALCGRALRLAPWRAALLPSMSAHSGCRAAPAGACNQVHTCWWLAHGPRRGHAPIGLQKPPFAGDSSWSSQREPPREGLLRESLLTLIAPDSMKTAPAKVRSLDAEHELPTAAVVRSSQATPGCHRGLSCAAGVWTRAQKVGGGRGSETVAGSNRKYWRR
jgi:hypothetical protein